MTLDRNLCLLEHGAFDASHRVLAAEIQCIKHCVDDLSVVYIIIFIVYMFFLNTLPITRGFKMYNYIRLHLELYSICFLLYILCLYICMTLYSSR